MRKETNPYTYGTPQKNTQLARPHPDYCIGVAGRVGLWICPFCSRLTLLILTL